ncbi:zinc finger protein 239-like [Teleopsis dalmanni]|uniref:zinc finger protein 239-like n=1 Tax=Teleopsis dalmanni TaxID=139649 RepID=UPI0018CDEC33|nr:zinc finger protein 239-like [Teleopsis dalmanni]
METLSLYELHKICRICLKSDLLVSIFSPTFLLRPIEMIEKLHIFKFQADDNLPTLLCQSCLYRVLDAYNLQQLAEASEQRLRDCICITNEGAVSSLNLNSITQDSYVPASAENAAKEADTTAAIYANICDIFERNSNDIEVEAEDVLNDVEIDVSSLTRSDADDTLSEVFVCTNPDSEYIDQTFSEITNGNVLGINKSSYDNQKKIQISKSCSKRKKNNLKIPEKCLECGKTFNYSGYLEAHKRIHSGEKPFKCKLCSRSFSQSSNLILHQRTHTGERHFQCEICSNFFTTSSNLKAHRLTHLEQRNFNCKHCNRSFKTMRELRRHEPIHRDLKDMLKCDMCPKLFTKQRYLNVHIASVHRGIRRHKCPQCAKVFSNRSNLVCHIRTHTGEKPFECRFCTWKFNQSSALVRHMKKHFKNKSNKICNKEQQETGLVNSALVNNFLHDAEVLNVNDALVSTLPSQTNFNLLSSLPSLPAMHNMNAELTDVGLSSNDSTLSSASTLNAYDFTKDGILDFSSGQHHHETTSLY